MTQRSKRTNAKRRSRRHGDPAASSTSPIAATLTLAPSHPPSSPSTVMAVLDDGTKGTIEMRAALKELGQVLTCTLCRRLFTDPVTLTCGHSFCKGCIDAYNCDNWHCPERSCSMPVTLQKGSFRKVHPSLHTAILSFHTICETLQKARPEWWNDVDLDATPNVTEEYLVSNPAKMEEDDPIDEDAMIDLLDTSSTDQQPLSDEEEFGTAPQSLGVD